MSSTYATDVEKSVAYSSNDNIEASSVPKAKVGRLHETVREALAISHVEERGMVPIPPEERTESRYSNIFTLWFCMSANILPVAFDMLGPVYALSLRDSSLVILFFTLLAAIPPAYLSILGPKTGMRQMIQARFSFGRWLVCPVVLLNAGTLAGFCIIIAVICGFCLSAITGGRVSTDVGIVIVSLLSLLIAFCGFELLHAFNRWAWIPSLIAIIIAIGVGGSHLSEQAPTEPATTQNLVSFGMIVASFMIPWACLSSDFSTYFRPDAPSWKIAGYCYVGLVVPSIPLMVLGAAIAGAVPSVPSWTDGYNENLVGGVFAAMLSPAGGFGKFIVVILAFSMLGNMAATSYSITLNLQILVPWLVRVPRYVFSILLTIILIPISIKASTDFFSNLENFVALIGYWTACFVAVVTTEHVVFRKQDCSTYQHIIWNTASKLPLGIAALGSSILSFGLIVPCMSQVWFEGPIARKTGDIGFEVGLVLTTVLYIPLRMVEKRLSGR